MTESMEETVELRALLDEYSEDLDATILIPLRRRDWIMLATLWWFYGGQPSMDTAIAHMNTIPIKLGFTPCMYSKCPHDLECPAERENVEQMLLKFIGR